MQRVKELLTLLVGDSPDEWDKWQDADGNDLGPHIKEVFGLFDENTLVIDIPITQEDRLAGGHAMSLSVERPMDNYDMIEFLLRPRIRGILHELRSRLKWNEGNFHEMEGYPTEQMRNLREVTLEDGSKATALVPAGTWPLRVRKPIEGSWECKGSPTGLCWYDAQKDPAWDFCIYCGGPHERK